MTTQEYFRDWIKVIPRKEMFKALDIIQSRNRKICPNMQDIFKAFTMFQLQNLRAVFLGQDPYPDIHNGKPRATGILFGNRNDVIEEDLSPSLKVIKESVINFEVPHNIITFDNSLESWARQGILMINSALTCELNRVGSHTMIWRPFIKRLLENLSMYDMPIVYVLFGETANTFLPYINKGNIIITCPHPAYFARTGKKMPNVFGEVNKALKGLENKTIRWFEEY